MPNSGMFMPILGMKRAKVKPGAKEGLLDPIFTKTQQRVLGALFGHPERSFYASELIRETGTGSGAAQRELARLERVGLIVSEPIGRQKHYRANTVAPLFPEVRSIILKTIGLAEPLRAALEPLASAIDVAFVYGSVAKAFDHAGSDIDLMVVSNTVSYGDVFGALENAGRELGRKISPTIYTRAEWTDRKREQNAFLSRVLEGPKIWVMGSAADLPLES